MTDTVNTALMKMMDEGFREVRSILASQQETASESRRRLYAKLEEMSGEVLALKSRVDAVERSIEASGPTLAEVRQYQLQVQGAGRLGRFLWWAGGGLLTAAFALYSWRQVIAEFLRKG